MSPQRTTFLPMPASTGCSRSNSAASAPTMKVSVPACAPPVPPDTGASENGLPWRAASAASSRTVAGSIVLESISGTPARTPASTPFSPV